jgi:hypothetical protein
MGFLKRKRKNESVVLGPIRLDAAAFMEALGEGSPWMASGEFDLRRFCAEIFDSGFAHAANVLRHTHGDDASSFWSGANLDEQWDRGSRQDREDAFLVAMRFQNTLDDSDYGDDLGALVLHATMRFKAVLLATGCDATYQTTYLQEIVSDPTQFGQHQIGG